MIIVLFVVLLVGIALLVVGANYFVDGAAAVARKLHIPGFIIGMTVVAMGTSTPELAVTITASLRGNNGMAISNVIGSNVFNLLVVCGVCAVITPLAIKKSTLRREFPVSILAEVLLLVLGVIGMLVGRVEGIILLAVFVAFLVWTVRAGLREVRAGEADETTGSGKVRAGEADETTGGREMRNGICVLCIVGGAAVIVIGGQLVVNCAERIALSLGMSETLVGLTICATGSSLPELVTSIMAARKKQADMALGNVIGSNIFNVLLVAGLATAISPIAITRHNLIDLIFVVAITVYLMVLVWRRQELRRVGGISLLAIYAAYMVYICMRGSL